MTSVFNRAEVVHGNRLFELRTIYSRDKSHDLFPAATRWDPGYQQESNHLRLHEKPVSKPCKYQNYTCTSNKYTSNKVDMFQHAQSVAINSFRNVFPNSVTYARIVQNLQMR